MDKILLNPADIESCWEKPDACMVKTKTGKVWVCEKEITRQENGFVLITNTMESILRNQKEKFVELPLKRGGKYDK